MASTKGRKAIDKICVYCGKNFQALNSRAKFCCDEHKILQNKVDRMNIRNAEKLKNKSLTQVAREARKAGMTYGRYVASLQEKKRV